MKLINRRTILPNEYRCELTEELDSLSKLNEKEFYDHFYHYILADDWCKNKKCLAIRVPGGTVGGIWIDDNNQIIKIVIDTNYVVKSYPDNVNNILQQYIGQIIEYN